LRPATFLVLADTLDVFPQLDDITVVDVHWKSLGKGSLDVSIAVRGSIEQT
jgi:hypothetical protein